MPTYVVTIEPKDKSPSLIGVYQHIEDAMYRLAEIPSQEELPEFGQTTVIKVYEWDEQFELVTREWIKLRVLGNPGQSDCLPIEESYTWRIEEKRIWTTVIQLMELEMIPIDIFDANGRRIDRQIRAFNTETGEVLSTILDTNGVSTLDRMKECLATRIETYPKPLTMVRINYEDCKNRRYWDMDGR